MVAAGSPHQFTPEERPLLPGSPYSPWHPLPRRIAYAAIGVLTGISSTFGNALVTVNLTTLGGDLGLYLAQVAWLPAVYVAMNATANLALVKSRARFGIPRVTGFLLTLYALFGVWQLISPGLTSALMVRAVSGVTAAALTTLTLYCMLQVFPPARRPLGLVCAISLTQLGPVLARLVPVEVLAVHQWQGLHLIELALALAVLAATSALPLPPGDRARLFEPLDLVTIALAVPAMLLLCAVLGVGRYLWWTDTPWLGWALAASVPLFAAVFLIEHNRAHPLLQTRWIGTRDIARYIVVAMMVRLALAEQTYGSVGLLTIGGLTNDQLRILFLIVGAAMLLGLLLVCLVLKEERIRFLVMMAALAIALAAWMDSHATNVTRPPQLYLSQALIGFGTTLFIGPALVVGFLRTLRRGVDHFVTFVVVFSTTQNVGGLAGSALLGSYQTIAARAHAQALSDNVVAFDPQVVSRLQQGSAAVAAAVPDPMAQGVQGSALLSQALNREANILAFNDTFSLVALLALLTALYLAYIMAHNAVRRRREAQAAEVSA